MRCELCAEMMEPEAVLDHIRIMHPDQYGDGLATWPDGESVVVDMTITPDEVIVRPAHLDGEDG